MKVRTRPAFTIIELLVVVSIIVLLIAVLLPAIGQARDQAKLSISVTNLRNLGTAHAIYAAEFNDRQLTFVNDSISTYGTSSCAAYTAYAQAHNGTHPNMVLGWGWSESHGDMILWRYSLDGSFAGHHCWAGNPINMTGSPTGLIYGFGQFRFGHQTRSFSPYLNGRFYDPIYFAPKETYLYEIVSPGFDMPFEFASIPADDGTDGNSLFVSSYCLSPAAMYTPDVFRWNPDTETAYMNPWMLGAGLRVPAMSHALYPELKTHMTEHAWLQNIRGPCNPAMDTHRPGMVDGCEPFYFNHGWESVPMVLFFDGHVEGLGVREAEAADGRHMVQAGYGLWTRDTPMGSDGYFIDYGYDFAETSFHILTTDGIRGRDKLGD